MTALLHLLVRQSNESDPIIVPVPVPVPVPSEHGVRHGSPVVAFIIGLSIIILASVLNAAGLNLTKLDHVFAPHPYLWWCPPIDRYPFRFEPKLFQKARGRETGYDLYGSLECYFICEALIIFL